MKSPSHKTEIAKLTEQLKSLNSSLKWKNAFTRSIITGFGSAIGAGLLVALVAVIVGKLTGLPIVGQVFTFLADHLPKTK